MALGVVRPRGLSAASAAALGVGAALLTPAVAVFQDFSRNVNSLEVGEKVLSRASFTDGDYGYWLTDTDFRLKNYQGLVKRFSLRELNQTPDTLNLGFTDRNFIQPIAGFVDEHWGYVTFIRTSKVARFNLTSFEDVESLDLTLFGIDLDGFRDGFTSGNYGYLVPFQDWATKEHSGSVVRFRTDDFDDAQALDLTAVDSDLVGFLNGFSAGTHGYLLPGSYDGRKTAKVARFSLQIFSKAYVESFDLAQVDSGLLRVSGGFFRGGFGYLAPGDGLKVARFDLDSFSNVEVLDLFNATPELGEFRAEGGFSNSITGYFVSNQGVDNVCGGMVVAIDLRSFTVFGSLNLKDYDDRLGSLSNGFVAGLYGFVTSNLSDVLGRFSLALTLKVLPEEGYDEDEDNENESQDESDRGVDARSEEAIILTSAAAPRLAGGLRTGAAAAAAGSAALAAVAASAALGATRWGA